MTKDGILVRNVKEVSPPLEKRWRAREFTGKASARFSHETAPHEFQPPEPRSATSEPSAAARARDDRLPPGRGSSVLRGFVDPEAALAKERVATRERMANHRPQPKNVAHNGDVCDIQQNDSVEAAAETAPSAGPLEQVKALVERFSIEQFEAFKAWFRGYCGAEGVR